MPDSSPPPAPSPATTPAPEHLWPCMHADGGAGACEDSNCPAYVPPAVCQCGHGIGLHGAHSLQSKRGPCALPGCSCRKFVDRGPASDAPAPKGSLDFMYGGGLVSPLRPEVQAELDAFREHLTGHREASHPDCRFCDERDAKKPTPEPQPTDAPAPNSQPSVNSADTDSSADAPAPPRGISQVRHNAERDPDYCPYCMRCTGLIRMTKVEAFYWRCFCGAEHDERRAASPAQEATPPRGQQQNAGGSTMKSEPAAPNQQQEPEPSQDATDVRVLRRLAERAAADPSRWHSVVGVQRGVRSLKDAEFISACPPGVVLSLLDTIEQRSRT